MTFLKSNITSDKVRFLINEDFINFKVFVLQNKKELIKLVKFMLKILKEKETALPIRMKMSDYQSPTDMEIKVETISRSNFRYSLTINQEDFLTFFKLNFDKLLKNNYDLELDYDGRVWNDWNELVSDNRKNKIRFDYQGHPYGIIFELDEFNNFEETYSLMTKMLLVLNKADIMKPFKFRFKDPKMPSDISYISYDTTKANQEKDFLIKHTDLLNFFKANVINFVENSRIHYDLQIEEEEDLDDGWTVAKNTKKQRSKAHGIAKKKLFNNLMQIQESV